ncbi:MAG: glycoside hydrolase family 43 protein [Verrucomicrobiota bacterium]
MKHGLNLLLAAATLLTGRLLAEEAKDGSVWALAYFRQRYPTRVEIDADGTVRDVPLADPMSVEKLHLALSTDGRHWAPLAGNEPIWDQRLRDPFIQRAPDGTWHLMGTGRAADDARNPRRPVCLHATSRDLITWETVESLPLMEGVTGPAGNGAGNIWAPEWFFDRKTGDFFLFWSSSFEDAGWKNSRLWVSRTRDWKSFTPAKILFDPDYSVIDGTLLESGGIFHLFHKEEEFGQRTGERRAIRLATSDALEGPFKLHQGPLNQGQIVPTITEGCAVMADPLQPGWLLYYDYCMTNRFGLSSSSDLLRWQVVDEVSFPPDARHGSVFKLSPDEAERLKTRFPAPREAQRKEP